MKNSSEKEKVLKLLRDALRETQSESSLSSVQLSYPYVLSEEHPIEVFAEKFAKGKGKFFFCADESELISKLKSLIEYRGWEKVVSFSPSLQTYLGKCGIETFLNDEDTTVGIGLCQSLISKTGSIIITSSQGAGTYLRHFTPIMIIVAFDSQICTDFKQTLENLPETPPEWVLSIKSGELVEEEIRELYMFIIEDEEQ